MPIILVFDGIDEIPEIGLQDLGNFKVFSPLIKSLAQLLNMASET